MRPTTRIATLLLAIAACQNAGEDRILSIGAAGVVGSFVYFDVDAGRRLDQPDTPMEGVTVLLMARTGPDTVAEVVSDASGLARFNSVPVGTYRVVIDSATFGDTVGVVLHDSVTITVTPGDTVQTQSLVGFPKVSIDEFRALPLGRKVFIEGVALNDREAFGDNTVHFADSGAAIRGIRVRQGQFFQGDSVRALGVRTETDGQPTIDDVRVFPDGIAAIPIAERVTTAAADTADGGRLDAAFVRVVDATINDSTRVSGDYVLTVDDGSGTLTVVFDDDAGLFLGPYVPTAVLNVTGLLVPTGTGKWQLKPRINADVVLRVPAPAPNRSRALPAGGGSVP